MIFPWTDAHRAKLKELRHTIREVAMNLRTVVQGKSPFLACPPLHDPLPADSPDAWESSEIRLHSLTVSVQFLGGLVAVGR